MTFIQATMLFALHSLLRLDILAWIVGLLLLFAAFAMLYYQYKHHHTLKADLSLLDKVKQHSVEYDLVLKAMKLAVWRFDVQTQGLTIETDYRDDNDCIVVPPGSGIEALYAMLSPEYVEPMKHAVAALFEGREEMGSIQYQIRLPHSERTYWSEIYATVDQRDASGKPLSIVGTLRRIDEQKRTESALMDALFHAEESDRLKSAFLANISHEIRTPLNAIVGFSDVLTMVDDGEERNRLVTLIKQNNRRLLLLFDDVVSMSKLEARGGGIVNTTTFSLKELFVDLVEKYREVSEDQGVPVLIADADQLPEVTTDRERLHEIMNQYLNNALKFTSSGSVTLGCTQQDRRLRIWVRDTGKGIPEEQCNDQLFERFVKVDEFAQGMGLGLSICRSMALTLNGTVGVDSKEGEGSTFWVELETNKAS